MLCPQPNVITPVAFCSDPFPLTASTHTCTQVERKGEQEEPTPEEKKQLEEVQKKQRYST